MVCFHKFLSLTSNFVEKIIKKVRQNAGAVFFPLLKFAKQQKKWKYLKFPLNHRRQILHGTIIFFLCINSMLSNWMIHTHTCAYIEMAMNWEWMKKKHQMQSSRSTQVKTFARHSSTYEMARRRNAMQCSWEWLVLLMVLLHRITLSRCVTHQSRLFTHRAREIERPIHCSVYNCIRCRCCVVLM